MRNLKKILKNNSTKVVQRLFWQSEFETLFFVSDYVYVVSLSKPIPKSSWVRVQQCVAASGDAFSSRLASKYYFYTPHNTRGERSRFAISRKTHLLRCCLLLGGMTAAL